MNVPFRLLPVLVLGLFWTACSEPERHEPAAAAPSATLQAQPEETAPMPDAPQEPTPPSPTRDSPATEVATFGGGCFWCTEAVLEQLDGVLDVTSGYMGGTVDDPSYQQVCTGTTGHAEVVQVTFDPKRVTYEALLDWFFRSHDPTTLNRQGADVGTQYRSVVFTHSDAQHATALAKIRAIAPAFEDPIVTELTAAQRFWPAEAYHQDYFRNHPGQGYCRVVIKPKLDKLGLDSTPK